MNSFTLKVKMPAAHVNARKLSIQPSRYRHHPNLSHIRGCCIPQCTF